MKEKIEKIRYHKGITLIALVVTIVVLVILAVISINGVIGEDGLVKKVEKGRIEYFHQSVWEAMQMEYTAYKSDKVEQKGKLGVDLVGYLQNKDLISKEIINGGYVINVEKLLGGKAILGTGADGINDVYKLEEITSETARTTKIASTTDKIKLADEDSDDSKYRVKYYGESGDRELGILADGTETEENPYIIIKKDLSLTKHFLELNIEYCLDEEAHSYWYEHESELEDKYGSYNDWWESGECEYEQQYNSLIESGDINQMIEVTERVFKYSYDELLDTTIPFYIEWYDADGNKISNEIQEIKYEQGQFNGPFETTLTKKVLVPDGAVEVAVFEDHRGITTTKCKELDEKDEGYFETDTGSLGILMDENWSWQERT